MNQEPQPIVSNWRRFQVRFALKAWDLAIVGLVALLVGGYVVVSSGWANRGPLGRPLRVGIVTWPGYAGGLVANNGLHPNKDSDFWRDEKLLVDFELITDADDLRKAFERGGDDGGIDVMWSTVDSLAWQLPAYLAEGVHPVAFMQVDWSRGGDAIVARKGIERIEDLKGKNIAVSKSASLWLLGWNLAKSSLTPDEIKHIPLTLTTGSPAALKLFLDWRVDAAVLWEPDVAAALKRSGEPNLVVSTATAGHLIADVMVAKSEFIRDNTAKIMAFVKGWLLKGTPEAKGDPLLAIRALRQEPDFAKLSVEETRALLDTTALATMEDNIEMFALAGGKPFFDHLFNEATKLWLDRSEPFFDHLFDEATKLWLDRHYLPGPPAASAAQAQATAVLQEIYNAPNPSTGCGPPLLTESLEVPFVAHSADLSPGARSILDTKLWLLLRANSNARFCIEVGMDKGENNPDLSAARERSVIAYLMLRCNCAANSFVASTDTVADEPSLLKPRKFIRLQVLNKPGGQK